MNVEKTEKEALELYEWMMDHGYSDYEARADAWPGGTEQGDFDLIVPFHDIS